MRSKVPYLLLILVLVGSWFYWTQIRPNNIRKACYIDVYTFDKNNTKWFEGKVWKNLGYYNGGSVWGWDYAGGTEEARFNDCLLLNNVNPAEK
jgi:hypothetical protein